MRIIRTCRDDDRRLTWDETVDSGTGSGELAIFVDPSTRFQTILGFGGAFTEAAAYTLDRIPGEVRAGVIRDYFSPNEGHGYVMGRTHIHSCDFALENYTYVDDNDGFLNSFDISRERRWVIPLIRNAADAAGLDLNLVASPWSPPAWMKTNESMNQGGRLKPEFRALWAEYYVRYIKAMAAEGIEIGTISVQNEPAAVQTWDSCVYTAQEERDFLKDYLGPALERAGLGDVRILIWDHNRDLIVERSRVVLEDPEAAAYAWGVGHHWYVSEEFENLSKVHRMFPDTHLIFTEGCQEGGVHDGAWHTGERYGRNIIGDLRNWVEGWIDWNLVLDEQGGPNHVGNYCDAPIIADTRSGEIHHQSSYYYIGHFSRYIKPGAVRIDSRNHEPKSGLHHLAAVNPDGSLVCIAMNESDESITVNWDIDGQMYGIGLPAHSIATGILTKEGDSAG